MVCLVALQYSALPALLKQHSFNLLLLSFVLSHGSELSILVFEQCPSGCYPRISGEIFSICPLRGVASHRMHFMVFQLVKFEEKFEIEIWVTLKNQLDITNISTPIGGVESHFSA